MFYLTTHSTLDLRLNGVDIRKKATEIVREETHCHHFPGYYIQLAVSFSFFSSFLCTIPQTGYHSLYYTSGGALAGIKNGSIGPP